MFFFRSPPRLVHSGPGKSSPLLDSELTFGLRSGTKQGVETRVFRVDSAKELSTWTHLLVDGCHNAAELIKEVTTGTEIQRLIFSCFLLSCLLHTSSNLWLENGGFPLNYLRSKQICLKYLSFFPASVSKAKPRFKIWFPLRRQFYSVVQWKDTNTRCTVFSKKLLVNN